MNPVDRFNLIRSKLPQHVKIVVVSKTKPVEIIEEFYSNSKHRLFGENRVQELELKHPQLPNDIDWHLIGHLQTNKTKYIIPYVAMIQSVDTYKVLFEINKEASKCNRVIPCLLQFHIASEDVKFGFTLDEVKKMLDDRSFHELGNISVHGVMGIATFTDDFRQVRHEFSNLHSYFALLKSEYFSLNPDFCEISMGMTNDYHLAVNEGSTIVRIGSGIFGAR